MSSVLVGYARCSTDQRDLTAQRDGILALGVEAERIYVDHGLSCDRSGLCEGLAACRAGDTLVVTKLDRLARSSPDARAIADELTTRSTIPPTPSVLRTVEGMKGAKAKGRLKGKQPKLTRKQEAHLVSLVRSGLHSALEGAELFGVGRSTVHRAIQRHRLAAKAELADASARR